MRNARQLGSIVNLDPMQQLSLATGAAVDPVLLPDTALAWYQQPIFTPSIVPTLTNEMGWWKPTTASQPPPAAAPPPAPAAAAAPPAAAAPSGCPDYAPYLNEAGRCTNVKPPAAASAAGPVFANTVTGVVENLSPIQAAALNHQGTYNNRAEVEAQNAEVIRLARARGLTASCELQIGSNWSGNTVYSGLCNVNGKTSGAVDLLRPGGFEILRQSNDDVPAGLPRSEVTAYRAAVAQGLSYTPATRPTTSSASGASSAGGGAEPGTAPGARGETLFAIPAGVDRVLAFVAENSWFVGAGIVALLGLSAGKKGK